MNNFTNIILTRKGQKSKKLDSVHIEFTIKHSYLMNTSVIGEEGGKLQENILFTDLDVDYVICSLVKAFQVVHMMYSLPCI